MESPAAPAAPERAAADAGYRNALLAILGVGALLRLLVFVDLSAADPLFDRPAADARMFLDWAARIAEGRGGETGAFFFNPLYAYLLVPFVKAFGPDPLGPVRLFQALLGLATAVLCAESARRLLRDRRAGLVAGALAALWPYLVYGETVLVAIEVSVFLNALALLALALFAERPGPGRAVAAGAALGLGILARPNLLLFAALLPAWFATLAPAGARLRAAARWGALLAAGVLLPLAPVLVRNLAVAGTPAVTTSMGVNLWLANNPRGRALGQMESAEIRPGPDTMEAEARVAAEVGEGRTLSPAEISSWWTRRTLRGAAAEPGPTALFLARKALCFLDASEIPSTDFYGAARADARFLRWNPLNFGLLAAFALLGCGIALRRRREALPLVLLFAAYAASLTVFLPLAHYRAPVLPAAFGLAALAALSLLDAARAADRAALLRLLGGLAACALLAGAARLAGAAGIRSLGPMEYPAFRRGLYTGEALLRRAVELRSRGREPEAEAVLAQAEAFVRRVREASPDDPERWTAESALAALAAARGDFDEEAARLEAALALRPGDARLLARRARNLGARGRADEALAEADRAVAADPEDVPVRLVRASLLLGAGMPGRALPDYETAVRLAPAMTEPVVQAAGCLVRLGRLREAHALLDPALERTPDRADLLLAKARALMADPAGGPAAAAPFVRRAAALGAPVPPDLEGLPPAPPR